MFFSRKQKPAKALCGPKKARSWKPGLELLEDRIALSLLPVPTIVGPDSGVPGQTLSYGVSDADSENDNTAESWQITDPSGNDVASGSSSTFSFTPTVTGDYTITFTVADPDDTDGSESTTLIVSVDATALENGVLYIGGTEGDDKIVVHPNGKQKAGATTVGVKLNGSSLGTFAEVNSIVVYGLGGNDNIQIAGSIKVPTELHGGEGNDRLKGGAAGDLLMGENGDDHLNGHRGNDLLIGGDGIDRLIGGPNDDILIGGTTQFDADSEALAGIMAAWNPATKPTPTYGERIEAVRGLASTLDTTTVLDDGDPDKLTGASGLDWFFATITEGDPLSDTVTGRSAYEALNDEIPPPPKGKGKK